MVYCCELEDSANRGLTTGRGPLDHEDRAGTTMNGAGVKFTKQSFAYIAGIDGITMSGCWRDSSRNEVRILRELMQPGRSALVA